MMSIVKDRPSDVILESLNRFYDAKLTGALTKSELSEIISNVGDLFANKIKQGKVTNEEIESAESFIECFTGINKNNYFNIDHEDLDRAAKMFLEGNYVAIQELKSKQLQSKPISNESSYTKGFRL